MTCTFHLYIKKDLYFAPKIKRSFNFFGGPSDWDIYRIKLWKETRFVLLTTNKSCSKNIFRVSNKANWRSHLKAVFFSQREQWLPLSCLHANCLGSVLMIHQYWNSYKKCFVRIKTGKQITAISHENRAKTEKNSNNYQEKRKINWELNLFV